MRVAHRRSEPFARSRLAQNCSAGSRVFIEPERNPSRSKVTNLKPRALKILVNSAAISEVRARDSSLLGNFDANNFAMMTHAELPETQRAESILALLDRAQCLTCDRATVLDTR